MDRRKELKEIYKNMKPDMGIFILREFFNSFSINYDTILETDLLKREENYV